MTRENLIKIAAVDHATGSALFANHVSAFIQGAEWAYANRWVKVEDGLPEVGQKCWVVTDTGTTMEDTYQEYPNGYKGFMFKNVTHWSPLPSPPKTNT